MPKCMAEPNEEKVRVGRENRGTGERRPNILRSAERETSRNELLSNANETRVLVTERSDSEMRMYISEQ